MGVIAVDNPEQLLKCTQRHGMLPVPQCGRFLYHLQGGILKFIRPFGRSGFI
jgi:hypothetical protein